MSEPFTEDDEERVTAGLRGGSMPARTLRQAGS